MAAISRALNASKDPRCPPISGTPTKARAAWGPLGARNGYRRVDTLLPYGFAVTLSQVLNWSADPTEAERRVLRQFLDRRFVSSQEIAHLIGYDGADPQAAADECITNLRKMLSNGWRIGRMNGGGFTFAQGDCHGAKERKTRFDEYGYIQENELGVASYTPLRDQDHAIGVKDFMRTASGGQRPKYVNRERSQ